MKHLRMLIFIPLAAALGCGRFAPSLGFGPTTPSSGVARSAPLFNHGKVAHIIVIIQENRTVDNLFNGLPGADTVRNGKNSAGQSVRLQPISLTAPFDLSHRHIAFVADYNNGSMNGFDKEVLNCRRRARCPKREVASYGYVPRNQVAPYWTLAKQYAFADNMFQTNQGPSLPAHQYLLSGTSTIAEGSDLKASENAHDPRGMAGQGGCDSVKGTLVETIDPQGNQNQSVFPCFARPSIMGMMNAKHLSWRYYQTQGGAGQWHGVDAVRGIWNSPSYKNVVWPSSRVLKDIAGNNLAQVSFVTPAAPESDHPGRNNGRGPAWVASIVNAVGQSPYWRDTVIFVVWDDWGGWYDHVKPAIYNSYELGFRVPLIAIGPYAKQSYISQQHHEFGSILKFVERTFGLRTLGTTDTRADDLSDCFDFSGPPRTFKKILSSPGPQYFLNEPLDTASVDDDF